MKTSKVLSRYLLLLLLGFFAKKNPSPGFVMRQHFLMALWGAGVLLTTLAITGYQIVFYEGNDGQIARTLVYGLGIAAVGCWVLMPNTPARQPTRT